MIKTILHQIWNERRQNGWIFLELVAVTMFLWLAIDPLFVLMSRNNIPRGYNPDNLYEIVLKQYSPSSIKWKREAANDSVKREAYRNIFEIARTIPEVEYVGTSSKGHYPMGGAYSSTYFSIDSTLTADGKEKQFGASFYEITAEEGDDFLATFGLIDAHSGSTAHIVRNENVNKLYVTRNFAMEGFGTIDVVGKKVSSWNKSEYVICGVLENVQMMPYSNYIPLVMNVKPSLPNDFSIFIRLKEGVDGKEFANKFNKDYAPRMAGGNIYCKGVNSHLQSVKEMTEKLGYENTYRLQVALTLFALTCAFLGVVSTFWIRANIRRGDIGVMRSVGASSDSVVRQFVIEALLLVTAAFCVALPLLLHKVYAMGFATPIVDFVLRTESKSSYMHDVAWMHFAIVSIITYLIIVSVVMVGVVIPAKRIAVILPSDALRDE